MSSRGELGAEVGFDEPVILELSGRYGGVEVGSHVAIPGMPVLLRHDAGSLQREQLERVASPPRVAARRSRQRATMWRTNVSVGSTTSAEASLLQEAVTDGAEAVDVGR